MFGLDGGENGKEEMDEARIKFRSQNRTRNGRYYVSRKPKE